MRDLYHNDMSTCAQKVRLVLAEKKLSWNGHHMDLRAGDTRQKEYIEKLNPLGVVPTLVDDGSIIYESTVIVEYLEDAYPEVALRPLDPVGKARVRLWTKQVDEGVHAATGVLSNCIAFRHQIMAGRSDQEIRDFIELSPSVEARERSYDIIFTGVHSKLFAPAIQRFVKLLTDMERTLIQTEWLAGDDFSIADIAYIPYFTRLEHLHLIGLLDNHPRVTDWYERTKARPSYEEAVSKWLNGKYLTLMEEKGRDTWSMVKKVVALG